MLALAATWGHALQMEGESGEGLRERLATALGGAYTLERELTGGGMARVFVATEARLGRRVVVKVLAPELGAGLSARRFEREVLLAARLQHPHLVPLLAAGDVGGLPYYTMPLIDGETLRARLAREGPLPIAEVVRLLRELADALSYAHRQGVVHRDLKPENVLLSGGHAIVADFGIAKALAAATHGDGREAGAAPHETSTALGIAVGTPAYMAPEQIAADPTVDARADLYALGCVAYELLTGAPPFAARSPQALLTAHLTETPVPLAERRADVPVALAALVTRLLAKAPDDRPQRADEVRRTLDDIETTGDAVGGAGRGSVGGPSRRRLRTAWLAAGALLIAVGGAAWFRYARGQRADEATQRSAVGKTTATDSAETDAISRRVLVVPFENLTGDSALAPLGRVAAEFLAQGLTESDQLDVAAGSGRPIAAGEAGLKAAAADAEVGSVVSGTYFLAGDSISLQARVTDVRSWKLLAPVDPVQAPRSAPQQLLPLLRSRVATVLAIVHGTALASVRGTRAPEYAALREFLASQDLFEKGDLAGALRHIARASVQDSAFADPFVLGANIHLLLGDPAGAEPFVRRLEGRRETLLPFQRGQLDALQGLLSGDLAGALAGARAIRREAPGWWNGYLMVAIDAPIANRPRESLEAAAQFAAKFKAADVGPAAFALREATANARHLLGDYERELADARAERAALPESPAPLGHELRALAALGRVNELGPRIDALEAMPNAAGMLPTVLGALADELDVHGQPAAATQIRERLVAAPLDLMGPPMQVRESRMARGHALALLGRTDVADTMFARLIAEVPTEPAYLAERAMVAVRRGQKAEVQRIDERLRALRRPYDRGRSAYARAQIAARLGDSDGALALLRTALATGVGYSPSILADPSFWHSPAPHADPAFASLRGDPRLVELLRPKG